jgi:hypothetical protein
MSDASAIAKPPPHEIMAQLLDVPVVQRVQDMRAVHRHPIDFVPALDRDHLVIHLPLPLMLAASLLVDGTLYITKVILQSRTPLVRRQNH